MLYHQIEILGEVRLRKTNPFCTQIVNPAKNQEVEQCVL